MKYTHIQGELDKLYSLLDKTRVAILGSDYQTRMQMKEIQDKVIAKIKLLQHEMSSKL